MRLLALADARDSTLDYVSRKKSVAPTLYFQGNNFISQHGEGLLL